jgi:hypothetical protein
VARSCLLRQEDHTDTILTSRRQLDALPRHFFAVKLIRNLEKDARTISLQGISTNSSAVIYVFQDLQTLFDDGVIFLAFDMGNKSHTASIMLIGGVVQTLPLRYSLFHHTHSFE